jgi:hypothetical protein
MALTRRSFMRPCETHQLAWKPFAPDSVAVAVGEDRIARAVVLGGAGRFESLPTLTLFVAADANYPVGAKLTVNVLPAGRSAGGGVHFEDSDAIAAPRIAESRFTFEGVVLARGSLDGEHAQGGVVVVRVLTSHQRWPRGCAIT